MIPTLDTTALDLGKDRDRITGSDARRQSASVDHILRAFCGPLAMRREIQVLADEVGMGKTYVALAAAYSLLSVLRDTSRAPELDDLADCCRCVLVITPGGNETLAHKWDREDEALLTRCAVDTEKASWFRSVLCESADQLFHAIQRSNDLRRRGQPVLLVAQSSVFTKKLSDSAVRFLTACLFRWWGNGLQMRERYHIVRGLAQTVGSEEWENAARWVGRGQYEIALWDWSRHERFLSSTDVEREQWDPAWERRVFARVSVTYDQMATALRRFENAGGGQTLEDLRSVCNGVPLRSPGDRRTSDYAEWVRWFRSLKNSLRDLFKNLWTHLLDRKLPLVIADEAHHWRNNNATSFRAIRDFVAPFARRFLLLTATPFQLCPQEAVRILNVIDHMEPAIGSARVAALRGLREEVARCFVSSERAGLAFSREWGALPEQLGRWRAELGDAIAPCGASDPRTEAVGEIWARLRGAPRGGDPLPLAQAPGPLRPFFGKAEELRRANEALRRAMSPLVIRHRRSVAHRRYWVGREYPPMAGAPLRPDQSRLHLAPGQALDPKDELVQYLLMKVVAELSQGRHRTTLGTALTGCYTTMWESREGRKAIEAADHGDQRGLLKLLKSLTGEHSRAKDAEHPKLRRVVAEVLDRWERGHKSLIFCFRVPTANRLHAVLSEQLERRLGERRAALLAARGGELDPGTGGDKAMQQFRRSLTARDSSGVPLFIDRVLAGWLGMVGLPELDLSRDDVVAIASIAARAELHGRILFPDMARPDRVFLTRAMEHVVARRLIGRPLDAPRDSEQAARTAQLLEEMADESWVRDRYGRPELTTGGDGSREEVTEHAARSSLAAHYDLRERAGSAQRELAQEMLARFERGRGSVFASLTQGPNLFAPARLAVAELTPRGRTDAGLLRAGLFNVTLRERRWDWSARRDAVDAIVRALLRDDLLFRMPTHVFSGGDETWAASLFRGLHQPLSSPDSSETLAQRVVALLDELSRMSERERTSYLEYSMNPRAQAVAIVKGETKNRTSVFSGFNTPLLPEILVCTAVGQEGIDLHRECRHVVHYDLGWNPATIEQRTGRTDRIGSKTERERRFASTSGSGAAEHSRPGLEVALPYLAATYDERMFEALRSRAQVFEILTGGDPTADRVDQGETAAADNEDAEPGRIFVPLPEEMLDDLKVDLSIKVPAEQEGAA